MAVPWYCFRSGKDIPKARKGFLWQETSFSLILTFVDQRLAFGVDPPGNVPRLDVLVPCRLDNQGSEQFQERLLGFKDGVVGGFRCEH